MNNLSGFEDSLHGAQTNADIFGLNMLSTANLVKCIDGNVEEKIRTEPFMGGSLIEYLFNLEKCL